MKTKRKVIYSAPLAQTLNVVQEGVICTSDPKFNGFENEEDL